MYLEPYIMNVTICRCVGNMESNQEGWETVFMIHSHSSPALSHFPHLYHEWGGPRDCEGGSLWVEARERILFLPSVAERKTILTPCWKLFLWLAFHCSCYYQFSSVQSLSCVWLFATPWTAARQVSLSITNYWSLLKFMSIELVMPSNHLIPCRPLLLPPSIFPSIRVFSNESVLHIRWPKYWSYSFSISPSNVYSGLISFRIDGVGSPWSPKDSQESPQRP